MRLAKCSGGGGLRGGFIVYARAALLLPFFLWGASGIAGELDYALVSQLDTWLHHPVLGDPSFDSFTHAEGNPVLRGSPPYEWPVNGFFFEDPVSKCWYLYVGQYLSGYQLNAETPSRCIVFRSGNQGRSWEELGPIFEDTPHFFEGESSPLFSAPDISVVYAQERYHLCFDWGTQNTTWENAAHPPADANSGAGYAWADRPEGPFHPAARPIISTRKMTPLLGKYRRVYASSIIPRAGDWLVLTLTDSGPYFGWALLGMAAPQAEGPYSEPKLLLHPESERFHPPLLEFFPAFVHAGYIYAPATSVARNRNFQTIFRAPIERAMEPAAWQIYQLGSVWHTEPVEHEHFGIWGQTFSGFVGQDGVLNVMFPSRDSQGRGTINIASRPWEMPYRERGFVISGHGGPSLAYLPSSGSLRRVEGALRFTGTVTLFWDHTAPLGPNRPSSDAVVHPMSMTRFSGLELTASTWTLLRVDATGSREVLSNGTRTNGSECGVVIERTSDENGRLSLDGTETWRGPLPMGSGATGFLAAPDSHAQIERFVVSGSPETAGVVWLYTEALVGAAQNLADWEERRNAVFRFGVGAVSKNDHVQAKWNVRCSGFRLWAPRGPEFGQATVVVDGKPQGTVDFSALEPMASEAVFLSDTVEGQFHAITLRPVKGKIPLDSLETVLSPVLSHSPEQ